MSATAQLATAPRPLRLRLASGSLLWIVLGIAVIGISIVPLLYTIDIAFYRETKVGLSPLRDLTAIIDVYTSAEYLSYLGQSLLLGAVVTAFSMAVGVTMAVLIARTDLRGKTTLDMLIILPLFLSPFTGLIAWIALGSEKTGFVNGVISAALRTAGLNSGNLVNIWSYGGIVWVMVLFFCPFAYLFTVGNLRGMDTSLEEAARASGATALRTLFRITLPLSIPAIFAAGLLIFVLAAETYTIPGVIGSTSGLTVLSWRIYTDSTVFPVHRAHAAAAGTVLLWVTIFGVWLQGRITRVARRFVTIGGKGHHAKPLKLGRWRPLAYLFVGGYVLCADVLPFGALILSSFMKYSAPVITADLLTTDQYVQLFSLQDARGALWNTIWLAALSGGICVLVGFLISFREIRLPSRWATMLAFLAVVPVAVPGVVYGIGLLWIYLRTPIYGTAWILLLAYIAKFLPYAVVVSRSGILQLHRELEESARTTGAGTWRILCHISMPLLKPTLIAILFFVMLMSMKELSASLLLYSQTSEVLSVLAWQYMDSGNYQFAAAAGVVQTLMMIGLVMLTRAVFRIRLEQTLGQ